MQGNCNPTLGSAPIRTLQMHRFLEGSRAGSVTPEHSCTLVLPTHCGTSHTVYVRASMDVVNTYWPDVVLGNKPRYYDETSRTSLMSLTTSPSSSAMETRH